MALKDFLARSSALAGASAGALTRLAEAATERGVERGEYLWRAGDVPVTLTIVRSGLV
jgi:CRP-like cAMP-binding protein